MPKSAWTTQYVTWPLPVWSGNSAQHIVPSWVVLVPHKKQISRIGMEPQSEHCKNVHNIFFMTKTLELFTWKSCHPIWRSWKPTTCNIPCYIHPYGWFQGNILKYCLLCKHGRTAKSKINNRVFMSPLIADVYIAPNKCLIYYYSDTIRYEQWSNKESLILKVVAMLKKIQHGHHQDGVDSTWHPS